MVKCKYRVLVVKSHGIDQMSKWVTLESGCTHPELWSKWRPCRNNNTLIITNELVCNDCNLYEAELPDTYKGIKSIG